MLNKPIRACTVLAFLFVQSAIAQEYTDDPWLLRFGATYVAPLDSSDGIIGDTGIGLIPGKDEADVDDALGFTFSLSYAFDPNWAVTLLAAAPYKHDINGEGALAGLEVGDTTHLPPSLTLEYRFNPTGRIRPYVGAGLNWTWFYKSDSSPALTAALDDILGGGVNTTDLDLDNSFGFAANAGIDWQLNDSWAVNTSIWFLDIDTQAEVFVNGAQVTEVDVVVDPLLFTLGLSYRF